jgi:hypothetical protein
VELVSTVFSISKRPTASKNLKCIGELDISETLSELENPAGLGDIPASNAAILIVEIPVNN